MKRVRAWLAQWRPVPPVPAVDDPVLGRLHWDALHEAWVCQITGDGGTYTIRIGRTRSSDHPPADCCAVGRRLAQDTAALERAFRSLREEEASRRPAARQAVIRSLRLDSISLRSEDGRVVGEMGLISDPPEFGWCCWHVDGRPAGIYQSD